MQINNIEKNKKNIVNQSDYIVNHFGFDFLNIEKKTFKEGSLVEDEKLMVLKSFKKELGNKRISPLKMFFYRKPVFVKNKNKEFGMGIDIINIESAVAEATVIKTAISVLKNEDYSNFTVVLNAIGDRDSQKRFKEELSKYYRNFRKELKSIELKKITKDPISIYYTRNKEYLDKINAGAPTAMQFLSEKSINHFQETIEFLESFNIDYIIDETMTGSKMFFSKIIFKIMAIAPKEKEQQEVGFGGRYDEIAEKAIRKKKISAIGLTLNFVKKNTTKIKLSEKKINLHLLKIGSTSKLKYLEVIEALSKVNSPIKYDINEWKISKQLRNAVSEKADYIILIGEAEAKRDKVMVRKMSNFSQTEVSIKDIGKYIKKLIK